MNRPVLSQNRPADFDSFWSSVRNQLSKISAAPERNPNPMHSTDYADMFDVHLTSIGPYRIFAYLSIPHGIGPFPARFVKAAMNRLGGPGYGILGEAMLEKVGLPIPSQKGPQDSGYHFYSGIYEKIRGKMRTFVANKIDARTITGETSSATA